MQHKANFLRMQDSTQADWQLIGGEFMQFTTGLPERVIKHLQILEGDYGGFPVDRYTHSLQTATRALRDGRDEEYVVCALLHDIGETLGSFNCRIPDDCIDSKRYPLFMARDVMRVLIEQLQAEGATPS